MVDIDGVVTPGEGRPADLEVLAALREMNALAATDPAVPAIALCSGRQAPYVEVFVQLIRTSLPSLFEHGAGMFTAAPFRYLFHPRLPADIGDRLHAVRSALRADLLGADRAFVQPGKEASVTLYPIGSNTVDDVLALARDALSGFDDFVALHNATCVEVLPVGIDKGEGLRWVASELDIAPDSFGGVGDAETDLGFLRLAGWSAAPANALPVVRESVDYVARDENGRGLIEILERVVGTNRARTVGTTAAQR
jgi:hypothetical protein